MKLNETWIKSTKSPDFQNCVEARLAGGSIEVRNSKAPEAGTARFTRDEWVAFREGVLNGEFEV